MESKELVMHVGKCGCTKLCSFSFGLALGLACGLTVFIGSLWVMHYGLTPMMEQYHFALPTFNDAVIFGLWALLKGFIFGFFVALFYNLLTCTHRCCKKSSDAAKCVCGCGCTTCKCGIGEKIEKTDVIK